MRSKFSVSALAFLTFIFLFFLPCFAVETGDVERVRNKSVLDNGDLAVIDTFVSEAVAELLETEDFTSIGKIRLALSSRKNSGTESAQAQYSLQFSDSAYKYVSAAVKKLDDLMGDDRKFRVTVNMLILINDLEQMRLSELVEDKLYTENTIIRYWAVRCVTNESVVKRLNLPGSGNLKRGLEIVKKLEALVDGAEPELIVLISEFAASLENTKAEELLLKIADNRMKEYANWTVEDEFVDMTVLKMLYEKLKSSGTNKVRFAQSFAQLYSYAMQRYVADIDGGEFLSEQARGKLASVLVETENCCIWRILGLPQSVIKKAVGRDDHIRLLAEHSRILGSETSEGELAKKLGFDYGSDADGNKITVPLKLPERPVTEETIVE